MHNIKLITKLFLLSLLLNISLFAKSGWDLWPGYDKYLHKLPKNIYNSLFFRAKTSKKIVAITFDDGPLRQTPALTKFLKAHNTPATFFLLASRINAKNAKYYKNRLFETGIHGYHHDNFSKLPPKRVKLEIKKAIKVFDKYHLKHNIFRPPYGVVSLPLIKTLKSNNIHPIIWSIDSRDWSKKDRPMLVKRVLSSLSSGAVILFHDHGVKLNQLEEILRGIKARGYKIVPLYRLMHYPTLRP